MTANNIDSQRIAFIDVFVFDDGSIRGGVLVTDIETRPYEFRVTSPIKPTQLQKVLYGSSLTEYVYGELICGPLIRAVKEKITLVITKNDSLLISRPSLSFPMVSIVKGSNSDDLLSSSMKTHKNYPGERGQAEIILNSIYQNHDLFEPFDRVRLAVSEVHRQNIDQKEKRV